MRKVFVAAIFMMVVFAVSGCSASTEQESPNDQLTVREQSAEKPSKQDQLNEYVEMLGIGAFGEISDGMGVALNAFESGDVDTVLFVAADIEEKCNRIIDMENIPEIAERSHEYAVSAASAYKEAAVNLAMAAKMLDEGKVSDATEYVSSVTENLEEARDEVDHMTSAVNDMKRQAAE